jgi:hypothetical protein
MAQPIRIPSIRRPVRLTPGILVPCLTPPRSPDRVPLVLAGRRALGKITLDHIAAELRAHYADLAAQPLPDRIVELLDALDGLRAPCDPAATANDTANDIVTQETR